MRFLLTLLAVASLAAQSFAEERIAPWSENPRYWSLENEPILLLGGSVDDNLFQIPDLEAHLDLLQSVGGNYVRCTMSSRDEGNVWAYRQDDDGHYNLRKWNKEYWQRFRNFLKQTSERRIVVQIEVWATFDFYQEYWDRNPFNPDNNSNYSAEESGLPVKVPGHPLQLGNSWFRSVPKLENNALLLEQQQRFVDRLLQISLPFGHVLYCMDNETAVSPEWGRYWSTYIKDAAAKKGVSVQTTEMWDPWNLADPKHANTFDHPEDYSFVDISQNNHKTGWDHWANAQQQRARIAAQPRPLNNVKIYGADGGPFGNTRDATERFWRNVLGGLASARFHRPTAGLGLAPEAQTSIKSARMLTDALGIFDCEPAQDRLSDCEKNEAYCTAALGRAVALYFPKGGEVALNTADLGDAITLRWLRIADATWTSEETAANTGETKLVCPDDGHWAVLVTKQTSRD